MKFYSGLEIIKLPGMHITTMFSDLVPTQKIYGLQRRGLATVVSVEYWSGPDITVAIVDSPLAEERYRYFTSLGFTYDLDYIPHITLCSGDHVDEMTEEYMGCTYIVGSEYTRIFKKD